MHCESKQDDRYAEAIEYFFHKADINVFSNIDSAGQSLKLFQRNQLFYE